jgi:hypothetical protein
MYWLPFLLTYLLTYLLIYSLTHSLTHSIGQNPSWEPNRFSACQEIPSVLWNPKIHYRIPKCPLPVPIPNQLDPVHTPHTTSTRSILLLSSHLRLGLPSASFPAGFPTKTLYMPLFSPIRATYPAHLILDLITRTVLVEQYRLWSSSLCRFLHSLFNSSHWGLNIVPNTLYSNTLSLHCSLKVSDQVSHSYKTQAKL